MGEPGLTVLVPVGARARRTQARPLPADFPTEEDRAIEFGGIGCGSSCTSGLLTGDCGSRPGTPGRARTAQGKELTPDEERRIAELEALDREVRAHEQAHLAKAGPYATSGATFTYTTGPDGKQYAVGGEVQIDISAEADPEATLRKAEAVRSAAMAPSHPSGQDVAVAARASQLAVEASMKIHQRKSGHGDPRVQAYGQCGGCDTDRHTFSRLA